MPINSTKTIVIRNVKIIYNECNVQIVNSFKIINVEYMEWILKEFVKRTGYKSKRSLKSWLKEWKVHNRLYRLGLFKSHTKDCDLEENEKLHRLIAYQILGI